MTTALADLAGDPRWVEWWAKPKPDGTFQKLPRQPGARGKGSAADHGNPTTWAPLDKCDGEQVGIVFNGDGLGGVDLDGCRHPDGKLTPWAAEIVERFNCYTEVSPSGTGVKIFATGAPASLAKNEMPMPGEPIGKKAPQIEAYVTLRFFAVTWQKLGCVRDQLEPREGAWEWLVQRMQPMPAKARRRQGEKAPKKPQQSKAPKGGGALARVQQLAEEVRSAAKGGRNDALNKAAYEAGGYVGGGLIEREQASALLVEAVQGWSPPSADMAAEYAKINGGLDAGILAPIDKVAGEGSCCPDFDKLVITDDPEEPVWTITIQGKELVLPAEKVYRAYDFGLACLTRLRMSFVPMKQANWSAFLQRQLERAEVVASPEGESLQDEFRDEVREFCRRSMYGFEVITRNTEPDDPLVESEAGDITRGNVWADGRECQFKFKPKMLQTFLFDRRSKFAALSRTALGRRIRELGGRSYRTTIAGEDMYLWAVPFSVLPTYATPAPRFARGDTP